MTIDNNLIKWFIQGTPVAWQRVKTGWSGKSYVPSKTVKWKNTVAWTSKQHRPDKPFDGPVSMVLKFYFKRPKSIKESVVHTIGRQDIDNLAKSIMDSLQGSFYSNDNQIVSLSATKQYSDEEGVEITICLPS